MSVESDIFNALTALVSARVYPDVAPASVVKPYIVYQQVGGEAINFLEAAVPSKKNGRFQVSSWATTRAAASVLGRQIEDTLRVVVALQVTVLGAQVATYDEATQLYGTRQDFGVWF